MKRACVFALCVGYLSPQIASPQEREPGIPTWVHIVGWGTAAIIGGVWFYKNFVKPPQPQKEKNFKEKALAQISYISTPDEQKALKKLTTPETVAAYVEEFWKRRDPAPGTPENELREEYSRRFEYASANFGNQWGREGWKTDMGRAYILYGPPDEIETLPWTDFSFENYRMAIKALVTWVYLRAADADEPLNIFSDYYRGTTKFIFADLKGTGLYTQIYSSEKGEKVDPRVYVASGSSLSQ